MHTPSTQPRKSIYYQYKVQPFITPKEHSNTSTVIKHPIVIIGAGPAGLTTAINLAKMGVKSVILESEQQVSEGSRAIVFTRRSMEILQQIGVSQKMSAAGLQWTAGNSFYRGERVFRMEAPINPNDRFGPLINVQQQYLEQFLVEQADVYKDLIEIRWGNSLKKIIQTEPEVHILVDTPEGEYVLKADWLVAADGAKSQTRRILGLKMSGNSYEGKFVIADIKIDLNLPTERLAFFDPSWNPGNTVLMHREPNSIWRIDYQLPPDESPEQALTTESLATRINAQLKLIGKEGTPWEMDWSSVYSARTMTLMDYRYGHVLFTGDAAHMLPIFGVRGANTGFQDAQNLAWKLGLVSKGLANVRFLDTYSEERVGAALEIIQESGKSTRFMTPPSHGYLLMRNATLSLSLKNNFVKPLFHWRTSRAHDYLSSSINIVASDPISHSVPLGALMQNVKLKDNQFLLDFLEQYFVIIHYAKSGDIPEDLYLLSRKIKYSGIPLQLIAIREHMSESRADHTLIDQYSNFQKMYLSIQEQIDEPVFLIRPDQHLMAYWNNFTKQISKNIEHIFFNSLTQ